jgi:signal transduction histidine kinase
MMSRQKPQGHLFLKYVAVLVILVSGALLTSGLVEIYFSYHENRDALVRLQREKAAIAALQIEQFIKDVERQIAWTLKPPWTRSLPLDQRIVDFYTFLRQVPAVTEVSYLDQFGKEQLHFSRLSVDVVGSGVDYAAEEKFQHAKSGKTYVSAVNFRSGHEPVMTMAVAEPGPDGGVTVVEIDLRFIWTVVSHITIGDAGFAYVVDARGRLIGHPDMSLVLQNTDLSSLVQVRAALASAPIPGKEGQEMAVARDLQGRQVLIAYKVIEPLRWYVFVEQPLERAFVPLYVSMLRTAVLLLVGFGISICASLILARKLVTPIQALQAGAAQITAGQLDIAIVPTSRDELGMLAESFNRMAVSLKESRASLERKVVETTTLYEISQEITAQVVLEPTLHLIAERARQLLHTDASMLALRQGDQDVFSFRAYSGTVSENLADVRVGPGIGLSGRVLMTAQSVVVNDYLQEYPDSPLLEAVKETEIRSAVAVPLKIRDAVRGVLLVTDRAPYKFCQEDQQLLNALADHAAIAIENATLYDQVRQYAEALEAKVEARTRALEESNARLQALDHQKTEFVSNVSHELRTPLTSIKGYVDYLLEGIAGELTLQQKDFLTRVQGNTDRLVRLINDLLDLARIEAGRVEFHPMLLSMNELATDVIEELRPLAVEKGVDLGFDLPKTDGFVRADRDKFYQVLLNLMHNAVKFTPPGGSIRVQVDLQPDGKVLTVIRDTGEGIPPEALERIFDKFHQVGQTQGQVKGSGLGLAIAKALVELHGGTIWVRSELGQGSTFGVVLLAAELEAS